MNSASFIPELFANINGQIVPHFQGITYEEKHDSVRLGAQLKRVKQLMSDSNWRTLEEIAEVTGDPQASISSRLRDFRKTGATVERRRRGSAHRGLFEYRLLCGNFNEQL